ncbi:MAG: (2Fe-2S)-binding protein [Chloroflexi bacterium]|nr:(2Fe-2S)-binding protein [Chloroflexota bacterium]
MAEITVNLTVNGQTVEIKAAPSRTLLSVLRDDLKLKSPKEACGQGDCGACVVLLNGDAVNSCLVLIPQVEGAEVLTIEGLAENGELHPLQQNFIDNWAFQCGYCTSGMLMSVYGLLRKNPQPTREEIKTALAGNLCRCTGYQEIIEAVEQTVQVLPLKN